MIKLDFSRNNYLGQILTSQILDPDVNIKSAGGRYRWHDYIIPEIVRPIIDSKKAKHSSLTIRGLCYMLEDLKIIPKLEPEFRKVYDAMSTARENGDIAIDAFIDTTRFTLGEIEDYVSVEQRLNSHLHYIGGQDFANTAKEKIPRWHNQSVYVEVWVEKASFGELLYKLLKDKQVIVVPNRGWSSKTFLNDNLRRLNEKLEFNTELKIQILYYGDLDPSGWAMDSHYDKELDTLRSVGYDVQFKRVAITKDQLDTFNLRDKTNPNPEVRAKLERNSNADSFIEEFGSLFQIELEALERVSQFEDLVLSEVDSLYDPIIYNKVLNLPENNLTYEAKKSIIKNWVRENGFD